ncbi:MAG: hypothetical protein ABJD97_21435 [Betaproteobacteria bacterium]
MTTLARRQAPAGAPRRVSSCALAAAVLACAAPAHAQFAATLGVDSVSRYRGTGTGDRGPVLRASVMADAPWAVASGAYAGVAGLWRTRDAGLASADAIVGWSGRFNALPALDELAPDWGWDLGVHRRHDGEGARYDFNEAMLGVLAPGWSARAWWSPHYFGGHASSLYTELNGSRDLGEHWHVFGHLGHIRYGRSAYGQPHVAGRADTVLGIGYAIDAWDIRLSRDALVAGHARDDLDARRRGAAWVLGASVAF